MRNKYYRLALVVAIHLVYIRVGFAEPGREMLESVIRNAAPTTVPCEFSFTSKVFESLDEGVDPGVRITGREVRSGGQTKVSFTRSDLVIVGLHPSPTQISNVEIILRADELLMRSRFLAPSQSAVEVTLSRGRDACVLWSSIPECGRFMEGFIPGQDDGQSVFTKLIDSTNLEAVETDDPNVSCLKATVATGGLCTVWIRRLGGTTVLEHARIEVLPGERYFGKLLPEASAPDGRQPIKIVDDVTLSTFQPVGGVWLPLHGTFTHATYQLSKPGEKPLKCQRYVVERCDVRPVDDAAPLTLTNVPEGYPVHVRGDDALRYIWRNGAVVVDPTPEAQSRIDAIVDKAHAGSGTTQSK